MNMKVDNICPVCGERALEQQIFSMTLEFKGTEYEIDGFHQSICTSCHSEVTKPEQSLHNKRVSLDARRKADNLLSGIEIRGLRLQLGLTQRDAAVIFGGGAVAFSKYEKGDVAQSAAMDSLLRVSSAVPEAYYWLTSHAAKVANKKLRELVDAVSWDFKEEVVLQFTDVKKEKKGRALHVQYEEVPLMYSNTLTANSDDNYCDIELQAY